MGNSDWQISAKFVKLSLDPNYLDSISVWKINVRLCLHVQALCLAAQTFDGITYDISNKTKAYNLTHSALLGKHFYIKKPTGCDISVATQSVCRMTKWTV